MVSSVMSSIETAAPAWPQCFHSFSVRAGGASRMRVIGFMMGLMSPVEAAGRGRGWSPPRCQSVP